MMQDENKFVKKRNNQTEPFDLYKIKNAVMMAMKSVGQVDDSKAQFIAQEVEKVLPSAVTEKIAVFHGEDGEKYKVVHYDQLHGLLIEAIKELKSEIEALKDGIR